MRECSTASRSRQRASGASTVRVLAIVFVSVLVVSGALVYRHRSAVLVAARQEYRVGRSLLPIYEEVPVPKAKLEKALQHLRKATCLAPNLAEAWRDMGYCLLKLGRYAEAVAACREGTRLEPQYEPGYTNLGMAYLHLGQMREARAAYTVATRLCPGDAQAWYGLGAAYYGAHRYGDAVRCSRESIRVGRMSRAHLLLALAYEEMGKHDLAIREYRILERLDAPLARGLASSLGAASGAKGKRNAGPAYGYR